MTKAKDEATPAPEEGDTGSSTITTSTAPTMNKQLVRAAILMAILAVSIVSAPKQSYYRHALLLMHLISFASWFGCSVWVSFVAGLIMFRNLPRHVFGRLQAKLFPAYFQFGAIMMAISIGTASAIFQSNDIDDNNQQSSSSSSWWMLGAILATILVNLVYLEPQTTHVMYLRHAVERRLGTGHEMGQLKPSDPAKANDPELKALSKQFGILHGLSSLANLAALGVGCVWFNTLIVELTTTTMTTS